MASASIKIMARCKIIEHPKAESENPQNAHAQVVTKSCPSTFFDTSKTSRSISEANFHDLEAAD